MPEVFTIIPTIKSYPERYVDIIVNSYDPYYKTDVGYNPSFRFMIDRKIWTNLMRSFVDLGIVEGEYVASEHSNIIFKLLDIRSMEHPLNKYFNSMILFIIAQHSFYKKNGTYQKTQLTRVIAKFYETTIESIRDAFIYDVEWIKYYEGNYNEFVNFIDLLINDKFDTIATIIGEYRDKDFMDDLTLYLQWGNGRGLYKLYNDAIGVVGEDFTDDTLAVDADAIINDSVDTFSKNYVPSYVVFNGLKNVRGLCVEPTYNYYDPNESLSGVGDIIANSRNYYDLAAQYKFMPRYNKICWNSIRGGDGIATQIVPVSGNISNISELQILNEYYYSQTFKKDLETNDYATVCLSANNKFKNSKFWYPKIAKFDSQYQIPDLIDNKIFITNYENLRNKVDDPISLKYVGYLIIKYIQKNNTWKLKEVITLDDAASNVYYDFNVLYNTRYAYKICSLVRWIYSSSIVEIENSFTGAPVEPLPVPSGITETDVTGIPITEIRTAGVEIVGNMGVFERRSESIDGGVGEEDARTFEDTLESRVRKISESISTRVITPIRRI